MKTLTLMLCASALAGALVLGCASEPQGHGSSTQIQSADAGRPGVPQKPAPRNMFDDRLDNAFPPTLSDMKYHRNAWLKNDCLRCHETGVGDAPRTIHAHMAPILLEAKCRSCHVKIPGSKPAIRTPPPGEFEADAFPPMMPASSSHAKAWTTNDCLLCHEDGIKGAPVLTHKGLPRRLKTAKCRTCHVQVRAVQMDPKLK